MHLPRLSNRQLVDAARRCAATQRITEPAGRVPLFVGVDCVGSATCVVADFLHAFGGGFARRPTGLHAESAAPAALSARFQAAALALRDAGLLPGWRAEAQRLLAADGRELLRVERAAFRVLGLQSRAVHVNGYRADGRFWIARRAANKSVDPGRLDNLAAGGIVGDESIDECLRRELFEEAGVPARLAAAARPAGRLRSVRVDGDAFQDEVLYVYDLELPVDFVPQNRDGEVAAFHLFDAATLARALDGDELTPDAAAVTADFVLRGAEK